MEEFQVNLIMSTLSPKDVDITLNNLQTSLVEVSNETTVQTTTAKRKTKEDDSHRIAKKNKNKETEIIELDTDADLFNFETCSTQSSLSRVRQEQHSTTPVSLNMNQISSGSSSSIFQLRRNVDKPIEQPIESEEIQVIFQDSEDVEMEESIPGSPEPVVTERQQRRRNMFQRCFEPTMYPQMLPGASQILAYNSDEE